MEDSSWWSCCSSCGYDGDNDGNGGDGGNDGDDDDDDEDDDGFCAALPLSSGDCCNPSETHKTYVCL